MCITLLYIVLAWGYCLLFWTGSYQNLDGYNIVYSFHAFFYEGREVSSFKTRWINMNTPPCSCLMKADLEHAADKLTFLKENYSDVDYYEYIHCLPRKELACCLCLLDSILSSIEEGNYTCTLTELIRLYRTRERIAKSFLWHSYHVPPPFLSCPDYHSTFNKNPEQPHQKFNSSLFLMR